MAKLFVPLAVVLMFGVVSVNARFMLSCQVISGLCQESMACFEQMSEKFPDCYMDAFKRSGTPEKRGISDFHLSSIFKTRDWTDVRPGSSSQMS
ncbi:hypothetical protein AAVH_13556 [Aphelenchoides avenae]|nr:hypothetical protein AAVH_13556 [Aphelenchus avenae]